MPPIRMLIADPDPDSRREMTEVVSRLSGISVIGECAEGETAHRMLQDLRPQMLIAAIQLPGLDPFTILEALPPPVRPLTILTTRQTGFAIRAFEVNAVDYLVRPFSPERLFEAVAHAKKWLPGRPDLDELIGRLDAFLQSERVEEQPKYLDRVVVKDGEQYVFLQVGEIDWIEAANNYVCLHVGRRRHLIRRSMAEVERRLDPRRFVRIHRSRIVNIERVREVHARTSGDRLLVLENGTELLASRTYREDQDRLLRPFE